MVGVREGEARIEGMYTRAATTTVRELVVMAEGPRRCRRQPGTIATTRGRERRAGEATKRR